MHANNLVHRDIKPDNILFYSAKTDIVKLCDFGTTTSCNIGLGQRLTEIFGSPYYIAPEVLKGEYAFKCDIWSIGAIMHTMLMRRVPFDGKQDQDIINAILTRPLNFHH